MLKLIKVCLIVLLITGISGYAETGYYLAKAEVAQWMMARAWSKAKANPMATVRPWPWADTWPVLKIDFTVSQLLAQSAAYGDTEYDEGELESFQVPTLESLIVLADSSGESLAFGPGLVTPQLLPGDLGNSIIAAHRDTHFKQIKRLRLDDRIVITHKDGTIYQFTIDQIKVVDSAKEQPIIDLEQVRLTLVTCYPFNSDYSETTLRYLVSGALVDGSD